MSLQDKHELFLFLQTQMTKKFHSIKPGNTFSIAQTAILYVCHTEIVEVIYLYFHNSEYFHNYLYFHTIQFFS